MFRLGLINPNTDPIHTSSMRDVALETLPDGCEVTGVSPERGPTAIESEADLAVAALEVVRLVRSLPDQDAYLIACFGDPGLDAAREVTDVPVIGTAEAAYKAATLVAKRFGIVTTLPRGIPALEEGLDRHGVRSRCVAVTPLLIPVSEQGSHNPDTTVAIIETGRRIVAEHGAEALILACGGMADVAVRVSEEVGVPVCDGVAFGTMLAYSLWSCGLRTGKSGAYGWPEPIAYTGMPGYATRKVFAAVFFEHGGPEKMLWEQVDDPPCGPQDVLVEVHACGLNHSDLDSRAGTSRWPLPLPWVLGAEFAGRVAQIGAEVEGMAVGDPVTAYQQYACGHCDACTRWRADLCEHFRVFGTDCWGGYGELVCVPARAIIPLRGEDFIAAAAAQTVVSTAWSMVVAVAAVRAGETVLVPSASGGVAGAAVQAARIAGARVIASVGSPEKIEAVRALGADVVFSHRETAVADAVGDATGGRGVDAVIDTTGGPLFADHLAAMAPDGRLVTCGAHAGEVVPLDIVKLFQHGHRILGFRVSTPDEIRTSLGMALDGLIRVPIDRTFALRDAAAAHAYMGERRHVGKIVLVRE